MNWARIEGNWIGKVRQQRGKLTGDDLRPIGSQRDPMIGRIQEADGIAKGGLNAKSMPLPR